MSFYQWDEGKEIRTDCLVYLEGVSLNFDPSWTATEVQIFTRDQFRDQVLEGCGRYDCSRSLEWVPSTHRYVGIGSDILVSYRGRNDGLPRTGLIAGRKNVAALAKNAEYQDGTTHLEIKRELAFVTSTVRLMIRKVSEYNEAQAFKLSVIIENVHRDEWTKLLEYQQDLKTRDDYIVENTPCTWRGNERVIEKIPQQPWQNDKSNVTYDIRHVAYKYNARFFNYLCAQNEAIQQGLSLEDFHWKFPNHHDTRIVRRPSDQTDTPLRGLRLEVDLHGYIDWDTAAEVFINSIELDIAPMMRSPSHPNTFSSCTLRLDAPYAALANATLPNYSSQIAEILTDSQLAECVITTSAPIHVNNTVQIMGSMMGDMYTGPISGGNVGGRNNSNHLTNSPALETVVSAVLRVMSLEGGGEGNFVPQMEGNRDSRRAQAMYNDEAGVDVEPLRKRRT